MKEQKKQLIIRSNSSNVYLSNPSQSKSTGQATDFESYIMNKFQSEFLQDTFKTPQNHQKSTILPPRPSSQKTKINYSSKTSLRRIFSSLDRKLHKPLSADKNINIEQIQTVQTEDNPVQKIQKFGAIYFDENDEKELKQIRRLNSANIKLKKETKTVLESQEKDKQKILQNPGKTRNIQRPLSSFSLQSRKLEIKEEFQFPKWISEREEFQLIKNNKLFNIRMKVVAICEITSFQRTEPQKFVVASYLEKLSFFKLMPFEMLMDISQRLKVKTYQKGQCICYQGEQGNDMYIIFHGSIDVIIDGMKITTLSDNQIMGRNALDNNVPRSATLEASDETYVLHLSRYDYQDILARVIQLERPKWKDFIKKLVVFNSMPEEKIDKLIQNLYGKFLSPKDNLYNIGDHAECFYIVEKGQVSKKVNVTLLNQNKIPIGEELNKYIDKTISKTYELTVKYDPGSLVGLVEILDIKIEDEPKGLRLDCINSVDDSFLLYINKGDFNQIFDDSDQKYFANYLKMHQPISSRDYAQNLSRDLQKQKKKLRLIEDASYSHFRSKPEFIPKRDIPKFNLVLQNVKKQQEKSNRYMKLLETKKNETILVQTNQK